MVKFMNLKRDKRSTTLSLSGVIYWLVTTVIVSVLWVDELGPIGLSIFIVLNLLFSYIFFRSTFRTSFFYFQYTWLRETKKSANFVDYDADIPITNFKFYQRAISRRKF